MPTMNQVFKDGVPYGGTPIAQTFGSETELTSDYTPEITEDYSQLPLLQSGTNSQSLWTKVASLFKNVRWINKILGNTALTTNKKNVTDAINELQTGYTDLNNNLDDLHKISQITSSDLNNISKTCVLYAVTCTNAPNKWCIVYTFYMSDKAITQFAISLDSNFFIRGKDVNGWKKWRQMNYTELNV